jgi:hypothetical protein
MALTEFEVRKAKVSNKAYKLADSGGLHVWVTPAGAKSWRWKYRFEGVEKLMSFGKYPEITLAMAREHHSNGRRLLATGIDPMANRKEAKTVELAQTEGSFKSIAALWLEHWQEGKSPRHVEYTRRRMEMDILPVLGARPVAHIEAPELVAMTKAIELRGASMHFCLLRCSDRLQKVQLVQRRKRSRSRFLEG